MIRVKDTVVYAPLANPSNLLAINGDGTLAANERYAAHLSSSPHCVIHAKSDTTHGPPFCSVCLSVCLVLFHSLTLSLCLSFRSVCLSVSLSFSLSLVLCLSLFLSVSVCLSHHRSPPLSFFFFSPFNSLLQFLSLYRCCESGTMMSSAHA